MYFINALLTIIPHSSNHLTINETPSNAGDDAVFFQKSGFFWFIFVNIKFKSSKPIK